MRYYRHRGPEIPVTDISLYVMRVNVRTPKKNSSLHEKIHCREKIRNLRRFLRKGLCQVPRMHREQQVEGEQDTIRI